MAAKIQNTITEQRWFKNSLLVATFLFLTWLRFPTVTAHLPYFTQEDEAHHFNRVVRMVQQGKWDPEYFHKPSLHFYLRMPVVAAAFLWNVRGGHIKKVGEIQTRDPHGIAGYAFTASHPGIVKWNRALSVALVLLSLLLVYLIARQMDQPFYLALLAVLLAGVSPELLTYSGTIGVDVVMMFFALLAVFLALKLHNSSEFSLPSFLMIALCCGLTVSSKYNALPIAFLPFFLAIVNRWHTPAVIAVALLGPTAGFFLGSPYILTSIPLFLDHLAYEIWHYGVAGHVGHAAEPGMQQARFYAQWLSTDGAGLAGALFAALGLVVMFIHSKKRHYLFLWFPITFLFLMIMQRANFTRNMIVVVPFVACTATYGLSVFLNRFSKESFLRPFVFGLALIAFLGQPALRSLAIHCDLRESTDSRNQLASWLQKTTLHGDTAVSGKLWLTPQATARTRVSRYNGETTSPTELFLRGFDRIIAGPKALQKFSSEFTSLAKRIKTFPGSIEIERIVRDPQIEVYEFHRDLLKMGVINDSAGALFPVTIQLATEAAPDTFRCRSGDTDSRSDEGHCWLKTQLSSIVIENVDNLTPYRERMKTVPVVFEVMSPWEDQTVTFRMGDREESFELSDKKLGQWQKLTFDVPLAKLLQERSMTVLITEVRSAADSGDHRRLGVAVRNVQIPV